MIRREEMAPITKNSMETYYGMVRSPADAIKLFEACRLGLLPRVQRRLSEKERQAIRSGSVFVWDEREAGMRRWTDGKSWSASRVSGSFLTYREMEGKRGGAFDNRMPRVANATPESGRGSDEELEPDGYRYKLDGLMKQSFSMTTTTGQHLHLISYYARTGSADQDLPVPTSDPTLREVVPQKGLYPDSSLDAPPATTRAPMQQQRQHHVYVAPSLPQQQPQQHPQQQPQQHPQQHPHQHHQPHPQHQPSQQAPYPPYGQPNYGWPPHLAASPYGHHYGGPAGLGGGGPYLPQTQLPPPPPVSHFPPPLGPPYGAPFERNPPNTAGPRHMPPAATITFMQGHAHVSSPPHMPQSRPMESPRSNSIQQQQQQPQPQPQTVNQGYMIDPRLGMATTSATSPKHSRSSSPRSSYSDTNANYSTTSPAAAAAAAAGGNKASLSALLHPASNGSEPSSAHPGSSSSAGSSPRQMVGAGLLSTPVNQKLLQRGHPEEVVRPQMDGRAISVLDKKFSF